MSTWARGAPSESLWRHADFMRVWSAATVSLLGSQISLIAIPFIAVQLLHVKPFEVALLATVEMLPYLLFTLPAGAWLDRIRRRPVLVLGDFGRAAALLTIPIAWALGDLSIWQLYAVAFVTGTFGALFDVADQSYLPSLVERDDLVDANARLQISNSVAQIGGPTLAGTLLAIAAAPLAILIDVLSYVVSAICILTIRRQEPRPERRYDERGALAALRSDVASGLRYVLGSPYLRPIAASTAISNLFGSAVFAIFPYLIWQDLALPPAFYGVVMGLASVGFLVGAALASWLPRRFGLGPTIVVSAFAAGPAFLLVALTPAPLPAAAAFLFSGWFLAGSSLVVYNVAQISLRQATTPMDMQSRMNATMRFIVWGTIPIGSLVGGALTTVVPLRAALVIGALGAFSAFLFVYFSAVRSLRDLPEEARTEEPAEEEAPEPADGAAIRPARGEGRDEPGVVAALRMKKAGGRS